MNLKAFTRFLLLLIWGICVWYVLDQIHHRGLWLFAVMGLGALSFLGFLWLSIKRQLIFPEPTTGKISKVVWVGIGALGLVVLFLSFQWSMQLFNSTVGRLLAALLFAGFGAIILNLKGSKHSILLDFAGLFLGYGIVYRIVGFLPEIQIGPFALGWSEGSRFYNASTFVSKQLYGQRLPLPILHPSRYLMQAMPFFVGIRDILAHRIWQVILWLGMTLWGSWLVAKRVSAGLKFPIWLVVAFCSLFFFQGAVYYHLMVVVVFVLIGYRRENPFQTLLFVILASIWAGISRVNWIPVPGLLAMSLYLIDQSINTKQWIKYLTWPVIWTVSSLAFGLISKQVYIHVSGENPALFDSAFSSALLWYRLLPNATFFLGILLAIGLVCLPLTAMVIDRLRSGLWRQVFWLRWLLLFGILAAFFAGGILVSLKIGGGGDLHNMDAFLVFFLLVSLNLLSGNMSVDRAITEEKAPMQWKPVWLMLALTIPVFFTIIKVGTAQFTLGDTGQKDIQAINQAIKLVDNQPGEVLFIAERQLLTFNSIEYHTVVEQYDKVFLMEMAMGENSDYLNQFYAELRAHKYKMIVTDTINTGLQGKDRSFSDENNAWVKLVLLPMLENYDAVSSLRGGNVTLLIPNGNTALVEQFKQLGN